MYEEFMADNAGAEMLDPPEGGAAAAETMETEPEGQGVEETTDPAGEQEGQEEGVTEGSPAVADNSGDVTRTKAFSQRLNEMSQQRLDEFIASQGYINPYTNEPVRSKADYDRYKQMYDANQRGQDPVLAAEVAQLRGQLSTYALREQDAALMADPERGEIYKEFRDEVHALVDYCRAHGNPNVDVNAAFNTVLSHNLPRILNRTKTASEQSAVRKMAANSTATPGPLGGGGENQTPDFAKMSDAEFEKYIARAERGELRKS